MDLVELNKILVNLEYPDSKVLTLIDKVSVNSTKNLGQGEEGSYIKIYKINSEDLYIKVEYYTDSYGDGVYVRGLQFVQPTDKKITSYEIIE